MADLQEDQMFFTFNQAEDILHVSNSTLHRWRKAGRFAAHKVGPRWLIPKADVLQIANVIVTVGDQVETTPEGQPSPINLMPHSKRGLFVQFIKREVERLTSSTQSDGEIDTIIRELSLDERREYRKTLARVMRLVDQTLPADEQGSIG